MLNQFFVNLNNLINNVKTIQKQNPKSLICAMVKANAYGVGLKVVVKTLSKHVQYFGVSNVAEAKQTSKYTNKKILIVGCLEKEINQRYEYTCHSLKDVIKLKNLNIPINIHIKINSGMNRYGVKSTKEFLQMLSIIKNSKLKLKGLFTHFATTDEYVKHQMCIFKKYVKIAQKLGFKPIVHVDNSLVNNKKNHHRDMVRIGFDLYNMQNKIFKPVVSIKSCIVQINKVKKGDLVGYNYGYVSTYKQSVAVVPIGYADGFSTKFKGIELKFKHKNCKVLNVCMDCFLLDVTNVNAKKGDAIFVLNKSNSLSKYSNFSGLSKYEVMCNFSHIRAKRYLISASNGEDEQQQS